MNYEFVDLGFTFREKLDKCKVKKTGYPRATKCLIKSKMSDRKKVFDSKYLIPRKPKGTRSIPTKQNSKIRMIC